MMIIWGISLATGSILFRRIIDAVTRTAAFVPDTKTHAFVFAVGSTALLGICRELRLGTRVSVGKGRTQQKLNRSSRQLNHDLPARNSWFFRNLLAGRKNCMDAIGRLVMEYLEPNTSETRVEQLYQVQNPSEANLSGHEEERENGTEEREVRAGEEIAAPSTARLGVGAEIAGPSTARPSILKKVGVKTRKKRANIDVMELQLHRPKTTKLKKTLDKSRRTRSGKIYNQCT